MSWFRIFHLAAAFAAIGSILVYPASEVLAEPANSKTSSPDKGAYQDPSSQYLAEVDDIQIEPIIPEKIWIIPPGYDTHRSYKVGLRITNHTQKVLRFCNEDWRIKLILSKSDEKLKSRIDSPQGTGIEEIDAPLINPGNSASLFMLVTVGRYNAKLWLGVRSPGYEFQSFEIPESGSYQVQISYVNRNCTCLVLLHRTDPMQNLGDLWIGRVKTKQTDIQILEK